MKALLDKTGGFGQRVRRGLLHYRNLPRSDGRGSPAELFFGRRQRRGIPEPRARARSRVTRASRRAGSGKTPAAAQRGRRREAAESADGQVGRGPAVTGKRSTGRSYFVQRRARARTSCVTAAS
jgi:hypothetical protein